MAAENDEEQYLYFLTEDGMNLAIDVLIESGLLKIEEACEKFLTASREKGDDRTEEEQQQAILICLLQAGLKGKGKI